MIRNIISKALCIAGIALQPIMLPGQGTFDLEEIKVVAPYEPTISDAQKILLNPSIGEMPEIQFSFDYIIPPRKLNTRFELEPISPARMRGEPLEKIYRGHVRGGYGNYATPYFEGFYNALRSNNHALGVHLKHISSGGGIDSTAHSGYSTNMAGIHASRFFGKHTLSGKLNYHRDVIHLYGYNRNHYLENVSLLAHIDSLTKKDIRHGYNILSAQAGFGTHRADSSAMNYNTQVAYQYLTDAWDAREHTLSLSGFLGRNISADPFGMADKQHFSMDAVADYYNGYNTTDTASTALISLRPRLWSKYNIFHFYVGLNATFQIDTSSYFRAYPLLGTEIFLAGDKLVGFASLSGESRRHSMYSLSRENPFLSAGYQQSYMHIKSDIGAGIKGKIGGILSYKLSINRAAIDNYAFFVNDTSTLLQNSFGVVYDDITRFQVFGELMSQFGERFSARLTASYFQYGLTREIEAWHTPANQFTAHLKYNIQNKIIISGDLYTRGETYGRVFDPEGQPASKIVHPFHPDINIGVEYRYTKLLSVFLNFHNVNNASIQRWMNYPMQGFNFIGGLTFSF